MDKITIVTVSYNAEAYIEKTMRSVCEQNYKNIEYIIMDGKSKDRTLSIANKIYEEYKNEMKIYIISEEDDGIYDAMNKGVKIASGRWILFLNTGDYFYNKNIISDIFFEKYDDETMGIYGDTIRYLGDLKKNIEGKPLTCIKKDLPLPFCHQSVFVKTEIMKKILFDTNYKLAADYDFFVKCYLNGYKFKYVPKVISCYAMGGISEKNTIEHLSEKIKIRESYDLEKYGLLKRSMMIINLYIRQVIKRVLPNNIINEIRGFHK